MINAYTDLLWLFKKLTTFIFNDMLLLDNATFGYFVISVVLMSLVIKNLINNVSVANAFNGISKYSRRKNHDY